LVEASMILSIHIMFYMAKILKMTAGQFTVTCTLLKMVCQTKEQVPLDMLKSSEVFMYCLK
jgi:hypothetical protein